MSESGHHEAESLASAALAKKLPEFVSASQAPLLQRAGRQFSFLWDECWIKVSSMKRLASVTLISAIFVFSWLATIDFSEISYSKTTGIGAVSGAFAELFSQLTLGMGVCLALYITNGFLEKALMERKALWTFLCAKVEAETPAEIGIN